MKQEIEAPTPHCVAYAASILCDKWTPMIVRALASGTKRFCALQTLAGGVNPRTMSARLQKLESQGIIQKSIYAEMPPKTEYALTEKGMDLLPIIEHMANWGDKYDLPSSK